MKSENDDYVENTPYMSETILRYRGDSQKFPVITALKELIDNSVDAQATIIEISYSEKKGNYYYQLIINDNGYGMSAETLLSASRYGSSYDAGFDGKIGRYGVGMKEAFFTHARQAEILTKQENDVVGRKMYHNYDEVIAKKIKIWRVKKPVEAPKKNRGTKIIINLVDPVHTSVINRTQDSLQKTYGYLLGSGEVSIFHNNKKLQQDIPSLKVQTSIEGDFDGRPYCIRLYMLHPSTKKPGSYNGITLIYNKRRVLFANRPFEKSISKYACIEVSISDGAKKWTLTPHKDDCVEVHELLEKYKHDIEKFAGTVEQKEDQILIRSAEKFGEMILNRAFGDSSEKLLSEIGQGKRMITENGKKGTIMPQNTELVHTSYTIVDPLGPKKHIPKKNNVKKSRQSKFIITWNCDDMINIRSSFGNHQIVIDVNPDHRIIREAIKDRKNGRELAWQTLLISAMDNFFKTREGGKIRKLVLGNEYYSESLESWVYLMENNVIT